MDRKYMIFAVDRKYMIFAVGFDGTLFSNRYPEIGKPNQQLIKYLRHRRKHGDKVILWTCRVGPYLQKAIDSCAEYGLEFDAINTNIPEIVEIFNNESRKVFADVYIDDKAILKPEYQVPFLCADDNPVVDKMPTTETEDDKNDKL